MDGLGRPVAVTKPGQIRHFFRGDEMKRLMITLILSFGALLLSASQTLAQAASGPASPSAGQANQASLDQDVALLRQDVQSQKRQLIASSFTLTDVEATKFWPVYDQYAAEYNKIGDEKYALIKEYAQGYGKLTDPQALNLINRSLALDEKVTQLRMKYVPIINKVLPGTKTATFFQMDRRVSALIDLQLAAQIPLLQDQK
jgi:hypothetical protein